MAINIDKVGRGEEVRWKLGKLLNNVMVPILHKRTVVRVEKLLPWMLRVCVCVCVCVCEGGEGGGGEGMHNSK